MEYRSEYGVIGGTLVEFRSDYWVIGRNLVALNVSFIYWISFTAM
jgi:hypothetical protein